MTVSIKRFILSLILLFYLPNLFSQSLDSIKTNTFPNLNNVLYLTLDKTIYTPGEVIWFAGYLLPNIGKISDSLSPDIISVALLKNDTTDFTLQKNYFINRGLCAGSISLPDSITPGNYQLIAGTNILSDSGKPLHVFRTNITIKSVVRPSFNTEFSIDFLKNPDTIYIKVQTLLENGQYAAGKDNFIIYHLLNKKSKTEKLSFTGSATVRIALSELEKSNYILYTTTMYNKSIYQFNLQIPNRKNDSLDIKFYPEGGDYLVAEIPQKVWWSVNTKNNQPVSIKAFLFQNKKIIDTLQTDETGIGMFSIIPQTANQYSLKIISKNNQYFLPKIVSKGIIMKLATTIPYNDTLSVNIQSNEQTEYKIAIAKMQDTLPQMSNILNINGQKNLKLPLNYLPKGLYSLALLNNKDSVMAKRLFSAHYSKNYVADIKTQKNEYALREKVKVSIALKDAGGNSKGGIITAYCTLTNRIDSDKKQNITSYYYYEHWLSDGLTSYASKQYQNIAWIENRLSTSNLNWLNPNVKANRRVVIDGYVFRKDKGRIKDALDLIISNGTSISLVKTDKAVKFFPNISDLVVSEDQSLLIKVSSNASGLAYKKTSSGYAIQINNPMISPMQLLSKIQTASITISDIKQSTIQQVLKESVITLEPIIIKARKNITHDNIFITNSCGDYVCGADVLNCPNHLPGSNGNKEPVKGALYRTGPYKNSSLIVYSGCLRDENLDNISPIYTSRKFEGMNSTMLANTGVKSELSTIYWEPFILVDKNVEIEFFTSDLPGKYKIFIEGVAENGEVFYGEKEIIVIRPEE